MSVAGYDGETVRSQVEIDTVHHRAQFVLSRREECAVDILSQCQVGYRDDIGIVADGLSHGELVGIVDGQREQTVLIRDLHDVLLLVHVEGNRLLRDTFHGIEQQRVTDGKAT